VTGVVPDPEKEKNEDRKMAYEKISRVYGT
jgi:hypothetical protein